MLTGRLTDTVKLIHAILSLLAVQAIPRETFLWTLMYKGKRPGRRGRGDIHLVPLDIYHSRELI
jgi:hypothetical protein